MQIESQSLSESCESCREQPPTHLKMQPHDDQEGASIQIIYAVIIKHQTSRARHRPGRPQTNNDSQMSLGNGNVASQIDTHTLRHVHTHRYIREFTDSIGRHVVQLKKELVAHQSTTMTAQA